MPAATILDLLNWLPFLFSALLCTLPFCIPQHPEYVEPEYVEPHDEGPCCCRCLLDARKLRRVLAVYNMRPVRRSGGLEPEVARKIARIIYTPGCMLMQEEMLESYIESYIVELRKYKFIRVMPEGDHIVARYTRHKPKLPK
ncbi:hypothetical protein BZA05DRAFT_420825 [Tricharina praecox]|uniref:uncharacterized protein n=1 Tax=Tricharina praecox TaxID=43433 RepID=UPI00221F4431|nr:uncharacterized protein BZA05DRAFT_420825 [Tricharina praecox]KAI5847009.1 hypothetical protein BZA05DRAFT_420825 [Tricharina praecox]